MTSHDVVAIVRRKTRIKKVGHTGTLDPNAAGVLPICIGQATKISQYLLDSTKQYRAELTLGITTDTQDAYGTITNERKVTVSTREIELAVLSFIGTYDQIPPMYSALKVKGKKLYELARQGIEVAREARRINIENIDIIKIEGPTVLFDVTCSKGTYIRTLCHDIGEKLGCGGIMSFLLRTATSSFHISSAITLEELEAIEDLQEIEKIMKPIDYPLAHIPRVDLDASYKKAALNGNKIFLEILPKQVLLGDEVRVYVNQEFIGIGSILGDSRENTYIKFARLFT